MWRNINHGNLKSTRLYQKPICLQDIYRSSLEWSVMAQIQQCYQIHVMSGLERPNPTQNHQYATVRGFYQSNISSIIIPKKASISIPAIYCHHPIHHSSLSLQMMSSLKPKVKFPYFIPTAKMAVSITLRRKFTHCSI